MAANFYPCIALTGGAAGALDAIDGTDLANQDVAIVVVQGDKVYHYVLDADSGMAENSPSCIAPDHNAGTKRWILHVDYGEVRSITTTGEFKVTNIKMDSTEKVVITYEDTPT